MHELTERIRFYLVPSPKELDEADKWIRRYLSEKAKIIKDMHNHYEGHFDQDKKVLEILGLSPSEVGESQTAHRCACGAEHLDKPKEVGEKVDSIMVGCYCDQCAGKQEIKGFHTFVPKPKEVDMQIMQKKKTMTSPTKPSARKVKGHRHRYNRLVSIGWNGNLFPKDRYQCKCGKEIERTRP